MAKTSEQILEEMKSAGLADKNFRADRGASAEVRPQDPVGMARELMAGPPGMAPTGNPSVPAGTSPLSGATGNPGMPGGTMPTGNPSVPAGTSPLSGATGNPAQLPPRENLTPQPPHLSGAGEMGMQPMKPAIGKEELEKAREKLHRYMASKASNDARIADDEDWWRLRHWALVRMKYGDKRTELLTPRSAWMLNSIMNKHADAMDQAPTCTVLPRAEDDIQDAEQLSSILPVILEANDWEQTYDHSWWTKLKTGTRVIGVFWDSSKENGAGDIAIREVDVLNLFWEPGIRDIQQSDAVFCLQRMTMEKLEEVYGERVKDFQGGEGERPVEYRHDDPQDRGEMVTVVDWYYKKRSPTGRTVLHLCKWVGDRILYATENEPDMAETGWYEDGSYPFVVDPLYPIADSICGFGEVDIMRDPQTYIDKMDEIILRNAMMAGKKRWFVQSGGGINEDEYTDWERDIVHVEGAMDETALREIQVSELNAGIYNIRQAKIDEMKETSGNRDFSQGGSSAGITAASAIAALQEAGSKLSRDMIKASYRAFVQVCSLVIERIRQFYDVPRVFRITGEQGEQEFVEYGNAGIKPQTMDAGFGIQGGRRPIFDMKVKSEKNSPFSRISQNELAKELYAAGVFNPEMADQALMLLDMMDFEGIDQLRKKISERGTLFDQMQQQIMALTQQVMALGGGQVTPAGMDQGMPGAPMAGGAEGETGAGKQGTDPTRDAFQGYTNTLPQRAAERARNVSAVR